MYKKKPFELNGFFLFVTIDYTLNLFLSVSVK